jgi:hypothetical protein
MHFVRTTCIVVIVILTKAQTKAQIPVLNSYPMAKATVYLDFDGQYVAGTLWNWNGPVRAQPAGLSADAMIEIFDRVSADFRPLRLNITTDSVVYRTAPLHQRIRIIFTPTSDWYGNSAGVACIGSFSWGDETPAWVFNALLGNDPKFIARCASHEIGHTLGLLDQSAYDGKGRKITQYATGVPGSDGWSPIMGASLYASCGIWQKGTSSLNAGVLQDDLDVMAGSPNDIGFRSDDYGNDPAHAATIKPYGRQFVIKGFINFPGDHDAFRLDLTAKGQLVIGHILSAADSDMARINIRLLNPGGRVLGIYSWLDLRHNPVWTNLDSGTYYLVVEDAGNHEALRRKKPVFYALQAKLLTQPDLERQASRRQILGPDCYVYHCDPPVALGPCGRSQGYKEHPIYLGAAQEIIKQ